MRREPNLGFPHPEETFHQQAFIVLNYKRKKKRQLLRVVLLRMLRLCCAGLANWIEMLG